MRASYFTDRSVALLVSEGGATHVGSGVLVGARDAAGADRVLVATAAHNLRFRGSLVPPRAVRVLPRGRYRCDPLRVLGLGAAAARRADVAWIEVDAVGVRRRGLATLALKDLARRSLELDVLRRLHGMRVHGYPAERVPWTALAGTRFDLQAATVDARATVCERRPTDLALAWRRDAGLLHPRGLSGGGVWHGRDPVPVPVALARAWHGGRGVLYCTPIRAWVDLAFEVLL